MTMPSVIPCGKVKDKKHGCPIIGYVIQIPKYSDKKLYITIDSMKWLIDNKYVRATLNKGKIIYLTGFENIENLKIAQLQFNGMVTSKENMLSIIKGYNIRKIEVKVAKQKESAAQRSRVEKEKTFDTSNMDENHPYVIKIIRASQVGRGIAGYVIFYKNNLYTVTKQYAMQLGKEYKLKNARYSYNGIVEMLSIEGGNRNVPDSIINPDIQLLDSIKELDEYTTLEKAPAKIIGCIFNQINSLIGIKVSIMQKVYNIKLEQIAELNRQYNLAMNKTLTEEEYEHLKKLYNVFIRKFRGQELYKYIKIISPFMTREVSEYLYGKENTIAVNDGINYGDIELRKKVLCKALEIEHSLIQGQKGIKINKSEIKVVARVATGDFISKKFKDTGKLYIIKYKEDYYVAGKGQLLSFDTSNIDNFIVLFYEEIKHNFYTDGEYLIAGLKPVSKHAEKEIKHDRYTE